MIVNEKYRARKKNVVPKFIAKAQSAPLEPNVGTLANGLYENNISRSSGRLEFFSGFTLVEIRDRSLIAPREVEKVKTELIDTEREKKRRN